MAVRAPEPEPPARVARRWPWLLALAGLSLAVALILWQLGAFAGIAGVTPTPTGSGATELADQANTQNAAIMLTTSAPTTGSPLTVTLAPDAIALAIITLPTGTASAALRTGPTGEILQTLPDRTIVQVLAGRQQLPDDSVWVIVRAPNGETGWVAEALLTYFNRPTAVLTPGPAATSGPGTPTIKPGTTNSPTGTPAASAQPGPTSISPGAAPTNTVPPATNIPAPSSTPAPTNTTAPASTKTPAPTNTPIIQLPTLPIPTLPLP